MVKGRYSKPILSWSLPEEPPPFDLQPGVYHRVLDKQPPRSYPSTSFNPYAGFTFDKYGRLLNASKKVVAGTRFAPVVDDKRKIVPTLYLASTDRAAYAEILVRGKTSTQLTYNSIVNLERVTIEINNTLSLLALTPPFLDDTDKNHYKISEGDLIYSKQRYYPETCRFASEALQKYTRIQGLHWLSRQEDNNSVYVLFENRIDPTGFVQKANFDALSLSELRIWVPDAAAIGVKIDKALFAYLDTTMPEFRLYKHYFR
ncbi:RES family NAD+ phosphorylase [Agaribacter flavus]|uniref:RES family NAD+ phosphorylase n=1 Tax=Agaribacter flavus TaxID=1902781 RepID=A0ABV7FMC7_9ALTE